MGMSSGGDRPEGTKVNALQDNEAMKWPEAEKASKAKLAGLYSQSAPFPSNGSYSRSQEGNQAPLVTNVNG